MKAWLIDTGPVVSYLDGGDPDHGAVTAAMDSFTGTLISSSAVITEAMHLAGRTRGGPAALAELVERSRMRIYDLCQPAELREAAVLMERYGDTPMDFADATLVLLAGALELREVLTLDRRGFSTYRTEAGHAFHLILDLL